MRIISHLLAVAICALTLVTLSSRTSGIASPPATSPQATDEQSATSRPAATTNAIEAVDEYRNSLGMTFHRIQPGTFMMGDKNGDASQRPYEVRLTRAYLIGVTEVTQAQWNKVLPTNPSKVKGDDRPAHMVTWNDAVDFCRKLSELDKRTYRLPTEAEWEYACRAGTATAYSFGNSATSLPRFAWYNGNAHGVPQPVAGKRPNPWGLYDMHGNVSEWCADWFSMRYPVEPRTDPTGPESGKQKVCRGGRCDFYGEICQSAYRDAIPPDITHISRGLRVVLEPTEEN